jgi:ABC-type multidrug transport system ATPase subunit
MRGARERFRSLLGIGLNERSSQNGLLPSSPTPLTDNAPVISVSDLIKQFGRFAALRGVTAEFSGGKLYAILGDNGAGKTTLLRTLAGLSQPSSGKVTILGANKFHDICQHVGYMAHPSLLYDEMSAMENLEYFARLYGISSGISGNTRSVEVIRAVGLDPDLARPIGQYSQGMRQRTSLARALLNDPKILLLDEPFSNVDIHSAIEMVQLLAQIRTEGKTIFVVTHQASLLEHAADEFVWMEYGKIIERTRKLKRQENGAENIAGNPR